MVVHSFLPFVVLRNTCSFMTLWYFFFHPIVQISLKDALLLFFTFIQYDLWILNPPSLLSSECVPKNISNNFFVVSILFFKEFFASHKSCPYYSQHLSIKPEIQKSMMSLCEWITEREGEGFRKLGNGRNLLKVTRDRKLWRATITHVLKGHSERRAPVCF